LKYDLVKLVAAMMLGLSLMQVWGCAQPSVPAATGGTSASSEKEITIFCAAGVKPAIDESARIYGQKYGIKLNINYGGGGEVLSNMILAQSGDIYIAPEQRFMKTARDKGAIKADTLVSSLAWMIPVIGMKKGNPHKIQSLSDLAKPGIRVVNGRAETTALGELVPQILDNAGLRDAVERNIITTVPQVNAIITMLIMEQADAGFIWHHFGTTNGSDIEIIWIPAELIPDIGEVQIAVSSFSREPESAQKYIEFLSSAEGKAIFAKYGYLADSNEASAYWNSAR
jgi:molybdate transport system substrate-binding protein